MTQAAQRLERVVRSYESSLVRVIFVAVVELSEADGRGVSVRQLKNFLRGNDRPRVNAPDQVRPVFGLLAGFEDRRLNEIIEHLAECGELQCVPGATQRVELAASARQFLGRGHGCWRGKLPSRPRLGESPVLEASLWKLRDRLARREGRAPYSVFPNHVLAAVATRRPKSMGELASIDGLGEARLRRYGRSILRVVRAQARQTT